MSFNLTRLENHAGSGRGLKLWSYDGAAESDNRAAITGSNYFNDAAGLLSVGDRIFVHASDTDFDCHVSAISAAGAVTVAALDAFSA
jgi:hypothetical protein